jgi:molybdopterin synthase catalytic subunit/molybdopterin converting factor small subunit
MRIRIELFASLREAAGTGELELDGLAEGATLGDARRELARQRPELGALAHARGVLEREYVDDRTPLVDGARVAFLPPVSGGAHDYTAGVFELSAGPIDTAACQARVAHPGAGAVLLFTGTTRDTHRGERVLRLEYEAFEDMAGPEMARIFARCRERFGDPDGSAPERALRMLCVHRTGTVAVGEVSVAIAVASPHRASAFDACRFLIDELKASLPVWKKEFLESGAHWVGDRS